MWEKLADAIERKNVALARQLLRQYPELVRVKSYQDETLLHLAAGSGSAEIVADLLVRGARPDTPDEFGWTPLHEACSKGNDEIVALFLQLPFNLDGASKKQETALHVATRHGFAPLIARLLKAGANHNYRNLAGNTPLHVAALAGRHDLMKILLEHGADLTARNLNGDIPLHSAAKGGWVEIAEWCLANGSDPEELNKDDRTFIDVALREGQMAFIEHFANLEQPIATSDEPNPLTATGIRLLVAKDTQVMALEAKSPLTRWIRTFLFGTCKISKVKTLPVIAETGLWFTIFPFAVYLMWLGFAQDVIPHVVFVSEAEWVPFIGDLTAWLNTLLFFIASHFLISYGKATGGFSRIIWTIRSTVFIRVIHFAIADAFFFRHLKFGPELSANFSRFWLCFMILYSLGYINWWIMQRPAPAQAKEGAAVPPPPDLPPATPKA